MSFFEGLDGVEEPLPTLIDEEDILFGDEDLFKLLDESTPGERVPEAPVVPEAPSIPAVLSIPAAPSVPATPSIPAALSVPAAPSIPAAPAVPATPSIPAAPVVSATPSIPEVPAVPAAPIVPAAHVAPVGSVTPDIPTAPAAPTAGSSTQNREPAGYTAPTPTFYPFCKPETIQQPQLKLSGVSSFKKINSRLMNGGLLNEKEEEDAIRDLERALEVLGHQKSFLRKHKADLEKWTSKVYGVNLSSDSLSPDEPEELPRREEVFKVKGGGRSRPQQNVNVGGGVHRRAVSLTVKFKGPDKRWLDKKIVAEVNRGWRPGQRKTGDVEKRGLRIAEADSPSKRIKATTDVNIKQSMADRRSYTDKARETAEDRQTEDASGPDSDIPETPGELWNWLQDSNYFPANPKRQLQPLPEDLILEAEDRVGRTSLVPLRGCGQPAKSGGKVESVGDDLRQRLTSALIVPDGVSNVGATHTTDASDLWTKPGRTGGFSVLDTSKLSLNQRVLVQLQGVGLMNCASSTSQTSATPTGGAEHETQRLQQRLAESIKTLNHSRVGLRRGISSAT